MAKSLSVEIAEEETALRGVSNRAAFLVVRDEVKQAIEDGWSLRAIWRTLHKKGRMPCGYETFRTYVIRVIGRPRSKNGNGLAVGKDIRVKIQEVKAEVEKESKGEIREFKSNLTPDKDRLF